MEKAKTFQPPTSAPAPDLASADLAPPGPSAYAELRSEPEPTVPVLRRRRSLAGPLIFGVIAVTVSIAVTVAALPRIRALSVFNQAPSYPATWDPRVNALTQFVEQHRGLRFKHPVPIDFLTPAQYTKAMSSPPGDVTPAQRKELDRTVGAFRSVGLVSGSFDLLAAGNQLNDGGTLAQYDPVTKRIQVRGTEMTPGLRVTLVHELTHVAQDQYFDLVELRAGDNPARSLAVRTLAEGDADRIEQEYVEQLNDADRAAYDHESDQNEANAHLDAVPPALVALFSAPYSLGSGLVGYLALTGGNHAVDDAFRRPPATDEQLFDPFVFAVHRESETPPAPSVARAGRSFDDLTVGSVELYLMLASRLGVRTALQAVDRVGGTSSVEYVHDGRTCVDVAVAGIRPGDSDALLPPLQSWAKTMPAGAARAEATANGVTLRTCDPGTGATAGTKVDVPDGTFDVLSVRDAFGVGFMQAGFPATTARCMAGTIVDRHDVAEIAGWDVHTLPGLIGEVRQDEAACEAGTRP